VFFQQPCLDLWLTSLADATAGSAGRQTFLGAVLGSQGCQLAFCSALDAVFLESHFFIFFLLEDCVCGQISYYENT